MPMLAAYEFTCTKGFIYGYSSAHGAPLYASTLLSSGSDDQIALLEGAIVFVVPFFVGLFRITKRVGKIDAWLLLIVSVVALYMFQFGVEAGSVRLTVEYGNWQLAWYLSSLWWGFIYGVVVQIVLGSKTTQN